MDQYSSKKETQQVKAIEIESFIELNNQQGRECENYFIGHGFGGSSLMNFASILPLLKKGNVIFWQIRGMGLSTKLNEYPIDQIQEIQQFFLKTIQVLLLHYKFSNCTFIGHSFSSYLLLLFIIRFPNLSQKHIKKLVLFTPIGLTVKQQDYNNYIKSCKDIFIKLGNKIAWAYQITYKSALRTLCSCCKKSLIKSSLKTFGPSFHQRYLMSQLIQALVGLPDGSQCLFFKLFEPRVIPKVALQPLVTHEPLIDILLVYGGEQDWVDKTGGHKITNRFPNKIRQLNMEGEGHNIPFNTEVCRHIYNDYL